MRTVALLNVVQWNHIHCSMLLCLDYAANYNEKVRLPPPITAYILLYISVYMAVSCIYWGWFAESGLSCGQVYTNDLVKEYGDRYRSAMKKLARVPEEFFGKLDLNNQIRCLLRLIPLKKFHICTIKKTGAHSRISGCVLRFFAARIGVHKRFLKVTPRNTLTASVSRL